MNRKNSTKQRMREYRQENKEKIRNDLYAWREANPNVYQAVQNRYRTNNANEISSRSKARYRADPEKFKERARQARIKGYSKYLVTRLKKKAFSLGIPFNLDESDLQVPNMCPVLGIPIVVGGKGQRDDCPSVDRIRPSLGYVRGNVRIVSMKANRIKNNATIDEIEMVLADMRRTCPSM